MPGGTVQYARGRMPLRVMQRRFNPRGLWSPTPGYGGGHGFRSPKCYVRFQLVGVTRDASDVALGNCVVKLFESATDIKIAQTTSDGSGNFTFTIGTNAGFFYYVYYKAGSPDVAGTSVNTIAADPA
jgi:hypothetical protein